MKNRLLVVILVDIGLQRDSVGKKKVHLSAVWSFMNNTSGSTVNLVMDNPLRDTL